MNTFDTPSKYLPPRLLEYWYYAQVFYSIMGDVIGLSISRLGVLMLVALGGVCAMCMGRYSTAILRPIAAPLACGVSFLAVQVLVHGESLMGGVYVSEFVPWMFGLVIVQFLALRRGFLHRAAIVFFLIGLSTLPYLRSFVNDQSRAGLERGIAIGNPNDLGAWFGFCCVYFTILGLETRRDWIRAISWMIAVGSLLVVGLTVSRTPLFAAAFSTGFAFRRVLKRGFFPCLSLIVLAWIAHGLGLFDRSAGLYAQRGLEESGRFIVWPLAIERFLQSPLAGVGASQVNTSIGDGAVISPHNSFILIALSSGVVPLMFFIVYWVRLFIEAFRGKSTSREDAPFLTSLLIYSLVIAMSLNEPFMLPWMMVTLAAVTGTRPLWSARRVAAGRMDTRLESRRLGLQSLAGRNRA